MLLKPFAEGGLFPVTLDRIRNCLAMGDSFYNSELFLLLQCSYMINLGSRTRNFAVGENNLAKDQRIMLLHSQKLICYWCTSWNDKQTAYRHTVTWMFLEFCWAKGHLCQISFLFQQQMRNCSAAWIKIEVLSLFWGSYRCVDEDSSLLGRVLLLDSEDKSKDLRRKVCENLPVEQILNRVRKPD
jgi:hypothetical protein